MRIHLLYLLTFFTCQISCQGAVDPFTLVRDGRAVAAIVVAENASPVDLQAASVLQDYIERISDVQLPISTTMEDVGSPAILIGQAAVAYGDQVDVVADGYVLRTEPNRLLIQGGSGKGTLYGVYTLLEDYLGCRKLDEGPAWVPRQTTITLPGDLNQRDNPTLVYRESFYPAAMDNEYLDWHKLQRFEDLWGMWGHSFFKLVSPQTYFEEHPEYFAWVDGRRQATQLCLSHPEVEKIAVATLRAAMVDNPDALYWSVAPMDGAGFCTCDACQAVDKEEGGAQGSLMRFVNSIAGQFPDKKFTTLAYTYTANPPRLTKPAGNVYVMLSSIDAQRQQALSNAPSAKAFREQLTGWKSLTSNLFVWDYTTQFTNYLAPFPDVPYLQPNVSFLAENGVTGIFAQGTGYTYGDLAELKSYLLAKALWNPEVDADTVRADFLTHYYGRAASHVADYLDVLQKAVEETEAVLDIYGNPVNNRKDYLSPERIDTYSNMLDKAEAAAEGEEKASERVNRLRLGMEYTVLQQARLYGRDRYGFLVEDDGRQTLIVKPGWTGRVDRFVQSAERAKVTEFSEGGGTPRDYQAEWNQLLSDAWIPGISVDKPVSLQHPFVPDYPAKREVTLTDGMAGSTDYSYNWLLFEQADLVAVIDLGKPQSIREVLLNYLDDPRHYLFAPLEVQVSLSLDGQDYKTVGTSTPESSNDPEAPAQRRTVLISTSNGQARYVRVTARCPQRFPPWFSGSPTRKPIIAVDEITAR